MNAETKKVERVIGLDAHPDTFTAALIQGPIPAAAIVQKVFNQVPLSQLQSWAQKHTTTKDLFLLEASGNSFHVVRVLARINRRPWCWRAANWASSRRPTLVTIKSVPCASAKPTW